MRRRPLVVALFMFVPLGAASQPLDDTSLDEDLPPPPSLEPEVPTEEEAPFGFGEEFALEARDRVISASRTETTIQEVPAIVTVITAEEIRARGFRTIIEILQTIPGFEGNRPDGNGWTVETFARGNPRTILFLVNGVSVVEPLRNQITLDRKLPLDIVERIEITSGPGGVLWGSNALLGVVNITTRNGQTSQGWTARVGGGSGPGELEAAEANVSYGDEILEDVFLFTNLNFFTTRGAELTVDSQKVVGILPAPDPDGISLFISDPVDTDPGRDYFGSLYLDLRGGPFNLNTFFELEQDRRPQAFGGAVLTTDVRTAAEGEQLDPPLGSFDVENVGRDALWWASLNYRERFAEDDFGLSATGYFVRWEVNEDPFGTFPPSNLIPQGLATIFEAGSVYRPGLNLDADYLLPAENHLIFGGEVFADLTNDVKQTAPLDPSDPDPDRETITETLVDEERRVIGALYLSDEWRASQDVALNAGARLQLSNTYDPTVLLAGALVWNLFGQTYVKLNYAEGFRPPDIQSTNTRGDVQSGITFVGNPNLDVERSRAAEAEINSVLIDGGAVVDRWFLRADYSFTVMDDIIRNTIAGGFTNSGTRFIHSVEVLTRLTFAGNHELSGSYYFVDAEDDEFGPIRNVANHIFNGHGRLQIVPDLLHLSVDVTWIGPEEDANRRVPEGGTAENPAFVFPTDVFIERIDPVTLLRAGIRAEDIAGHYSIGVFGYNILNQEYRVPDFFFDDRVATRPYYQPRWSVFGTAEAHF